MLRCVENRWTEFLRTTTGQHGRTANARDAYPHGLESSVGQAMLQIGRSILGTSLLGVVLGLVLSAGALRVRRSELHGVVVYDVTTILLVVLTISAVALLATVFPALRIASIDPARPLREE